MKVRCVNDSGLGIPVILNSEYVVYAITEIFGVTWYCICDESYYYYPKWIPEHLFEISDNRISRYWIFSFKKRELKDTFILSFPEWAKNLYFYGHLVEKDIRELEIFQSYKKLMDLEFPNHLITEVAEAVDEQWLYCASCIDAWENSDKSFALVACPVCLKVMNNPRYENSYPKYK